MKELAKIRSVDYLDYLDCLYGCVSVPEVILKEVDVIKIKSRKIFKDKVTVETNYILITLDEFFDKNNIIEYEK